MISTVTPSSLPATWRPRVERAGATAVIVGLALVKLGQKLIERTK
jgi:hypothetical protein